MVKTTGLASGRAFYPSVGILSYTYTKRDDMAGITGKLVKCLDTRFDVDDSIVAVISIANFSSWPDTIWCKRLRGWACKTLIHHFTSIHWCGDHYDALLLPAWWQSTCFLLADYQPAVCRPGRQHTGNDWLSTIYSCHILLGWARFQCNEASKV